MSRPRPILMPCILIIALFVPSLLLSQTPTTPLRSGPMVGYSEMTGVQLWVQTTRSAAVRIKYWPVGNVKRSRTTDPFVTRSERAFVAHVPIDGLTPGTRYEYQLLIDGKTVSRPYPLQFQTQALWQWRTDPPAFSVAIGSCLYVNEAEVDRPGKPYGSDERILGTITSAKPDMMLWLGDNTYYREVDWNTKEGLRYRWSHTRALPELQPLLGSVHNYYMWDDHDFGPNDADRSYRLRTEALETHKLFTANGTYGTLETAGTFGRFEWADVEFFMMDDRIHRSPNDAPAGADKVMWGSAQMQWLKDGLVSSRAPFKIIANGNQVLNPLNQYESMVRFRKEYDEILSFVKQNRIPGVVFISGDRHMSELIVLTDTSFYPLYDFTSSSLTAGLSKPRGAEVNNPFRVPGTLVDDAHSFGMLRFSGPRTDRTMVMECVDVDGAVRWTHSVRANDLRPPPREDR